jgi:hypothetical protein
MTKLNSGSSLLKFSFIFILTACSTNPQNSSLPEKEAHNSAKWKLNLENARNLVNLEGFSSASKLAATRPKVIQEITSIQFELLDSNGVSTNSSVMHFSKLPHNLELVTHSVPATKNKTELNESFIDVYGLAPVQYWNSRSRFPEADLPPPDQLQLISGKIFSINTKFVIEQKLFHGETLTTECTPSERIPAKKIHPSLTGYASVFACNTPSMKFLEYYWYIEDSARYVASESWNDGELQSKFKIVALTFN